MLLVCSNYVNNHTLGKNFEKEYIFLWRKIRDENIKFESKIQEILDEIWYNLDVYVYNKKLRNDLIKDPPVDEETIDDIELRKRVGKLIKRIEEIKNEDLKNKNNQ